jgi:Pyruvate/2-oxoacid:ferredoxin oxidoreductase delta subunit
MPVVQQKSAVVSAEHAASIFMIESTQRNQVPPLIGLANERTATPRGKRHHQTGHWAVATVDLAAAENRKSCLPCQECPEHEAMLPGRGQSPYRMSYRVCFNLCKAIPVTGREGL